jgi:PleD family two-component response regulator
MPIQSTLMLIDAIAEDAKSIRFAASDEGLREQAALVRALADELGHHNPSERRTAALHAQLGEELSRLAELLPEEAKRERQPESAQPLDVLIVEDDESALQAKAGILNELGYACRLAAGAEEGLREYQRKPAEIVISEWTVRDESGPDLCRALRQVDPNAYVILVTAPYDEGRLLEGARRGVDDLLPEPIDVDELASRLSAAERLLRAVHALERVKDRLHAKVATTHV